MASERPGSVDCSKFDFDVGEPAGTIGCEGIDDARAVRGIAAFAEGVDCAHIVGGASRAKFLEDGKVVLLRPEFEPAAQKRIGFARLRAHDDGKERAVLPFRRSGAARELLIMDGVEIAPPSIAVSAPLRMQRLGRHMRPKQGHAADNEALAITVEQLAGCRAAQPFAHRPNVEIDDASRPRIRKHLIVGGGDYLQVGGA